MTEIGCPTKNQSNVCGDLWALSLKLKGLAALFGMGCGDPPMDHDSFKGIGYLLTEIVDDLEQAKDILTTSQQSSIQNS